MVLEGGCECVPPLLEEFVSRCDERSRLKFGRIDTDFIELARTPLQEDDIVTITICIQMWEDDIVSKAK